MGLRDQALLCILFKPRSSVVRSQSLSIFLNWKNPWLWPKAPKVLTELFRLSERVSSPVSRTWRAFAEDLEEWLPTNFGLIRFTRLKPRLPQMGSKFFSEDAKHPLMSTVRHKKWWTVLRCLVSIIGFECFDLWIYYIKQMCVLCLCSILCCWLTPLSLKREVEVLGSNSAWDNRTN